MFEFVKENSILKIYLSLRLRRTRSLSMNPDDRLAVVEPLDLKSYTSYNHRDYGLSTLLNFSLQAILYYTLYHSNIAGFMLKKGSKVPLLFFNTN